MTERMDVVSPRKDPKTEKTYYDKIGAAFATASLVLKGEFVEAARTAGGTVVATGNRRETVLFDVLLYPCGCAPCGSGLAGHAASLVFGAKCAVR